MSHLWWYQAAACRWGPAWSSLWGDLNRCMLPCGTRHKHRGYYVTAVLSNVYTDYGHNKWCWVGNAIFHWRLFVPSCAVNQRSQLVQYSWGQKAYSGLRCHRTHVLVEILQQILIIAPTAECDSCLYSESSEPAARKASLCCIAASKNHRQPAPESLVRILRHWLRVESLLLPIV